MLKLSLRRTSISAALALATLNAAALPALASVSDGTSNTIQVAIATATLDQAHHRVVVTGAQSARLTPGQHLRSVQVVGPRLGYTFENVMVESLTGVSSGLSLNFTKVEFISRGGCVPGVDLCLIESEGLYPPVT